jgi:hypothetical protein
MKIVYFSPKAPTVGVRARKHRAHDCMDAGGRATQEAKAEERSLYLINEHPSTELTLLTKNLFIRNGILIAKIDILMGILFSWS